MSPAESKSGTNSNRVRMFGKLKIIITRKLSEFVQRCNLLKWASLEKHSKKTRANDKYTLHTKLPRINCYKNSFFVRIINQGNARYETTTMS